MQTTDSLMHGWPGLFTAYLTVQAPMLIALARRQIPVRRWAATPLAAVPLTLASGAMLAVLSPALQGIGLAAGGFWRYAWGVGLTAALGYAAGRYLARQDSSRDCHRRGALVEESLGAGRSASARPAQGDLRAERRRCAPHAITLAGIAVPTRDESKHFKLVGTTGTGKSTAIAELLGAALARGDRAVIADPDGGYLARFHDPRRGDVILNPFEPRSHKWDLFGEIDNAYDIDQLARSLLPDQGGSDRSWMEYARTFFAAVTRQARAAGVTDLEELYRLLVSANTKELRALVTGTPAQPFLEEHNARMFDSIRSVASSAVGSLEYIAQQRGTPLSIRRWIRGADEHSKRGVAKEDVAMEGAAKEDPAQGSARAGVLFIPYRAGEIAALRSTISAWMRLAIFEAMSQPEADHRLWFVVDELDALGQIDGLKDALARLRKFGGRCVLGFQSVAQVSSTYGQGEARTIIENCGNTLILRCSGSDHGGTAHFASQLIGQREVRRTSLSHSRRPTEFLSSTTVSEHIGIEPAVMDAQIEQLPDLCGYLKFASEPKWRLVRLPAKEADIEQRARTSGAEVEQGLRARRAPVSRHAQMKSTGPHARHCTRTRAHPSHALEDGFDCDE